MATNFSELKRSRNKDLQKLTEKLSSNNEKRTSYEDDRFWKPAVDKAGNGYAVIRFLPAAPGEDVPFIQMFSHGFQGPTGKWYIENSLTTINQKDPVSEYNSGLWNSGVEWDKEIARKQKRRLSYYANVYIIKDPANPENEGEVKIFKFGKKIFDKLNDMMNPEFEDETPVNPFDFWEGANFKLKIRKVEGYQNYDKSEFDSPSPLSEDDDEMERIWNSQHKLQEFLKPENFKTYEELKSRLEFVLELGSDTMANVHNTNVREANFKPQEPVVEVVKPKTVEEDSTPWSSDEDDDDLSYFEKLAEG